jgi:hypothetical protein
MNLDEIKALADASIAETARVLALVNKLGADDCAKWVPVAGYEDSYEVSDLGEVRSVRRARKQGRATRWLAPRILKSCLCTKGHPQVGLSKNGKARSLLVASIVAQSFLGPKPEHAAIVHLNGDRMDCRAVNLTYTSPTNHLHPEAA